MKQAKADFDAAAKAFKDARAARKTEVADEEKRIKPDMDAAGDRAGTIESLSGPLFQWPGTMLFKLDELQSEVDATDADLPDARRKTMAKQLVAPRGRPDRTRSGAFGPQVSRLPERRPPTRQAGTFAVRRRRPGSIDRSGRAPKVAPCLHRRSRGGRPARRGLYLRRAGRCPTPRGAV